MIFSTLTSVLALAAYASAAAPAVTYPHAGTVWENTWYHNVTWTPQSGNGDIMLLHDGNMTPLKNGVDLSTGRVVIQVPQSVTQAADWVVQIMVGSDSSTSQQFIIGPPSAVAPGGTPISGSALSTALSASGSGSASSMASMSMLSASGVSASSSAAASVSSQINSLSASAISAVASSLSAASVSAESSISSQLSAASSSGSKVVSSVVASATAPSSSASSGAAPLGASASAFGAIVAAGLVAITTLSGALVL